MDLLPAMYDLGDMVALAVMTGLFCYLFGVASGRERVFREQRAERARRKA